MLMMDVQAKPSPQGQGKQQSPKVWTDQLCFGQASLDILWSPHDESHSDAFDLICNSTSPVWTGGKWGHICKLYHNTDEFCLSLRHLTYCWLLTYNIIIANQHSSDSRSVNGMVWTVITTALLARAHAVDNSPYFCSLCSAMLFYGNHRKQAAATQLRNIPLLFSWHWHP